jgi:tRNA(Arg) A34 adenosine deaminase TadA
MNTPDFQQRQKDDSVVIDDSLQQPPLQASVQELQKLLETIEHDILPKTRQGVRNGNKVFGAALLNKDFELILAETNNEMKNPLFHGEVNLINEWSKVTDASKRGPMAQESIFLSTHEPCCMCIRCVSQVSQSALVITVTSIDLFAMFYIISSCTLYVLALVLSFGQDLQKFITFSPIPSQRIKEFHTIFGQCMNYGESVRIVNKIVIFQLRASWI